MSLRSASEELKGFVEFDLGLLGSSPPPPLEKIGPVCDETSLHYRTLAGGAILLDGDTDAFHHCLARSAEIRVHYLARCVDEPQFRSPHRATGNSAAFFDALAARHDELARRIVSLSSADWWQGEEYEDDFCFAYFFHRLITGASPADAELGRIVDQFAIALEGEENGKLKICQALVAHHQASFDDALEFLLDDYEAILEEERQMFWPDDRIVYRVKCRIYTEALAVLNVAQELGLRIEADYRYCPPLCRAVMRAPFPAVLNLGPS